MAHDVSLTIPPIAIGSLDMKMEIKEGGVKLGTLHVSKGNLEWVPRGRSSNRFRLQWSEFANLVSEHGKPVRTAKRPGS